MYLFNPLKLPDYECLSQEEANKGSKRVFLVDPLCFFCLVFAMPFQRVCLYVPCGHLLGKGWPLGSHLWCPTVSMSLSHWFPVSGVVLDCVDS